MTHAACTGQSWQDYKAQLLSSCQNFIYFTPGDHLPSIFFCHRTGYTSNRTGLPTKPVGWPIQIGWTYVFSLDFEFGRFFPVTGQTDPVYRNRWAAIWSHRSVKNPAQTTHGMINGAPPSLVLQLTRQLSVRAVHAYMEGAYVIDLASTTSTKIACVKVRKERTATPKQPMILLRCTGMLKA